MTEFQASDVPEAPVHAVFEDGDLLVLEKLSGLLCVPGRGPDKSDCLSRRAQCRWPDALVVHRLDQATSGLVLMARSPSVQRLLSAAFAEQRVHKRYQAIVQGELRSEPNSSGWATIDLPIAADWERRPLRVIDLARGKPSQTQWRTLGTEASNDSTRLELAPLTGRTHQLRVHLAAIGHPILGDALYGQADSAPRLLLHATRLAFEHPRTGEEVPFFSAPSF
ncbi:MAG: RluA family pseudouridine synthase [Giesbergeria sp.]